MSVLLHQLPFPHGVMNISTPPEMTHHLLASKNDARRRLQRRAEQTINKLRKAEVLRAKGIPMEEVMWQLGVSRAPSCKWRKEYGGFEYPRAFNVVRLGFSLSVRIF
jgi:hypothetical protein